MHILLGERRRLPRVSIAPSPRYKRDAGYSMRPLEAQSTAHKPLPPVRGPPNAPSLVLFYAYREPACNAHEHSRALKTFIKLCEAHDLKGRGRCAPEGVNCTLTGGAQKIRNFCAKLREWDAALFGPVDFKITDNLGKKEAFKRLTVRKTDELVGYGLSDAQPQLSSSTATHLDAVAYHKLLEDPEAVVVDVRNQYETEIGRMRPPAHGATFLDPKVRNSHEIPRWLNAPETQAKLAGKRVLMYCTGGIRCERASALLSELSSCPSGACPAQSSKDAIALAGPKEIVMVRGGVERYLRTFPDGGYWAGANYLFDRRFEQRTNKEEAPLGACALCGVPCDLYRGKVVCAVKACGVPVLVCQPCRESKSTDEVATSKCRLCRDNFAGARRVEMPDVAKVAAPVKVKKVRPQQPRVFVGNLPFTAERAEVLATLGVAGPLAWLVDRETGLFYGSAVVECGVKEAARVVARAKVYSFKLRGRKLRLDFGPAEPVDGPSGPRPPCAHRRLLFFSSSEMTKLLGRGLSAHERPPAPRPESNTGVSGDYVAHDVRGLDPIGNA